MTPDLSRLKFSLPGPGTSGLIPVVTQDARTGAVLMQAFADAAGGERIRVRVGPAGETLAALAADGAGFDLVFVDADKAGYVDYYEQVVPRLRPGGVVLADNTLWSGRIVEEPADGDDALAGLRRYNDRAANDPRVRTTILTVGDGVTVSQRL